MIVRLLALILALVAGTAATGQGQDTQVRVVRFEQAFARWLDNLGLNGALAVWRKGQPVAVAGNGMEAQAPVAVASLSKAITGICAAELVRLGKLDWEDSIDAGGGQNLTLAALITHTSGLVNDSTQKAMRRWLGSGPAHKSAKVLERVRARNGGEGEPGRYAYNNENHALAALVIERETGQPYSEICASTVLAPAGVDVMPQGRTGAFLPWGGWEMSVDEYAGFHAFWFATDRYARTPGSVPSASLRGGVQYGPGTFMRAQDKGSTFWHFGALCFPLRFNTGSYAVTWYADWTLTATWDGCVSFDDMFALDAAMVQAAFGAVE